MVGSGNSAGQAAMHFARFARTVTIVLLKSSLVNISRYLVDSVESAANIQILANSVVTASEGDEVPRTITITNCHTNKQQIFASRWLFVASGSASYRLGAGSRNPSRRCGIPSNWPESLGQ